MKICIIGDLHLTIHTPKCRLDDYVSTQLTKLEYIFNYCVNNHVNKIVAVGDVIEKAQLPLHFASKIIKFFNSFNILGYNIPFYSVQGNHDLFHNSLISDNCIFGVLKNAGLINIDPPVVDTETVFKFCHYNQDIPEPEQGKYNVLVMHNGVSEKEFKFATKEKWYVASELISASGYDLIFSGHNHKKFYVDTRAGSKRLYNCGSICRSTVDQYDHVPYFYVFDSITKEVEEIPVPIQKAKAVINKEAHDNKKEIDSRIASFVDGFDTEAKITLDFHSNLWQSEDVKCASKQTIKILEECVNG